MDRCHHLPGSRNTTNNGGASELWVDLPVQQAFISVLSLIIVSFPVIQSSCLILRLSLHPKTSSSARHRYLRPPFSFPYKCGCNDNVNQNVYITHPRGIFDRVDRTGEIRGRETCNRSIQAASGCEPASPIVRPYLPTTKPLILIPSPEPP